MHREPAHLDNLTTSEAHLVKELLVSSYVDPSSAPLARIDELVSAPDSLIVCGGWSKMKHFGAPQDLSEMWKQCRSVATKM